MEYQIVNGTHYNKETNGEIVSVLENARLNHIRITLDYGDIKTGRTWGEIYDINGYVGRSMGPIKIPILLHNSRSIGGGGILDHCIIRIMESKGKRILYKNPNIS